MRARIAAVLAGIALLGASGRAQGMTLDWYWMVGSQSGDLYPIGTLVYGQISGLGEGMNTTGLAASLGGPLTVTSLSYVDGEVDITAGAVSYASVKFADANYTLWLGPITEGYLPQLYSQSPAFNIFNGESAVTYSPASIPEPVSAAVLGWALAGLAAVRRYTAG